MIRITFVLSLTFCLAFAHLCAQSTQTEWKKDSEASGKEQKVVKEKRAPGSEFAKWSFGVSGGYGYRLFRTGKVTTAANQDYFKSLKSGIVYGANVSYYPWPKVGFGLRYERNQSEAEIENNISEKVVLQHFSGLVTHRNHLKNGRTVILTSLLLGYQPYHNSTVVKDERLTFSGKTMGWGVSTGIEHRLGEKFSMSLTGTLMMGAVYRMKRDTEFSSATLHLSKDESVDLSRFSLTLGFGFLK